MYDYAEVRYDHTNKVWSISFYDDDGVEGEYHETFKDQFEAVKRSFAHVEEGRCKRVYLVNRNNGSGYTSKKL